MPLPPQDISSFLQEAFALHSKGQLEAAAARYRAVLQQAPDTFHALHMLGVVHLQRGQPAEAAELIGAALRADPNDAIALSNHGLALRALDRLTEAALSFEKSVAVQPGSAANHHNRALVLYDLGRRTEALVGFERAIALDPTYADAHGERARTLAALDRYDEALKSYDTALSIRPDDARLLYNRGLALMGANRYDEARQSLARAIDRKPDFAEAHMSLGECLLVQGDLRAGWQAYEWRWSARSLMPGRDFDRPRWRGEPVSGKTLLLHAEQGFGDTIQFCRYAPLAAARGARVILEVPAELTTLMQTLGDCEVIARGAPLPAFDFHAPLLSLPLAFGTDRATIPPAPYLKADPARTAAWRERLDSKAALRVGVVWSGRATHLNDRKRTIPLATFAPLLQVPNVEFIDLQTESRPGDEPARAALPQLKPLGATLTDFSDTAALVSALDLVITVDTAVAHLAGALGKEVWTLLPKSPDWRWMLERADSPWYPSMRLLRQITAGDWVDVIGRAMDDMQRRTL